MYNPKTTEAIQLHDMLSVICDLATTHGIKTIKVETVEIEFDPQARTRVVFGPLAPKDQPIGEDHGMPTDDQLLFASSIPLTDEEIQAGVP